MTPDDNEDTEAGFFSGKRPWSKIKDTILAKYMAPYLRKVAMLKKPIVLVDGFAGPGIFEDGTYGSPVIVCNNAEQHVPERYLAVFVNKEAQHHLTLEQTLSKYVQNNTAFPIIGDAQDLLRKIHTMVEDATLFIYMDPFGLKGCEFQTIASLLKRDVTLSTEILLNMSMPTLHRLSAHEAVAEGRGNSSHVRWRHELLTNVLGGDYWKEIMLDRTLSPNSKEEKVMAGYRKKLEQLLPFTGFCPVRETRDSRVKYYMTFCSRHPDAMLLMNDIMLDAYFGYLHEQELESIPLLAPAMPSWKEAHAGEVLDELKKVIYELVSKHPGHIRPKVWEMIVKDHFMKYKRSEFNKALNELVEENHIESPTSRPTKRLNDYSVLIPKKPN